MGTPLYTTDIIPMTSRPTLTVMDDGDYFVILDTSTGKISKILKTNIMTALKITYDNTSGLTAETVQAALDELVVNLGSSDSAILALSGRLDTLEGTGEGSVAKAIDDAVSPVQAEVDNNRLYSDSQYLALKAKADALQVKCNTLQAEVYTDDPILQYGATEIIGKGYEADDTPIDVSANVVDGSLDIEQKGLTITNLLGSRGDFESTGVIFVPDFSDGTVGSLAINTVSPISGSRDTKLSVTTAGTSNIRPMLYSLNSSLPNLVVGHVYFLVFDYKVNSGTPILTQSHNGTSVIALNKTFAGSGRYGFFLTCGADNPNFGILYFDGRNLFDIQWDNFSVVDLTALGLSTITDTDILAKLLPYVDGTQNVGKIGLQILDADDVVTQTIFLPAIGNSLPNGVADNIKTVADGWEHVKRVGTPSRTLVDADFEGISYTGNTNFNALRTVAGIFSDIKLPTNSYTLVSAVIYAPDGTFIEEVPASAMDSDIDIADTNVYSFYNVLRKFYFSVPVGTSFQDAKALYVGSTITLYPLAEANYVTTRYELPHLTSGKTIHRFAGEEKIALYGTGLTFSENVLSVLSAIKFVSGEMTDITDDAAITDDTVTFSGVSATDVVYVKVEHDVDRPLGVLEHTPAVSNTASRLEKLEDNVVVFDSPFLKLRVSQFNEGMYNFGLHPAGIPDDGAYDNLLMEWKSVISGFLSDIHFACEHPDNSKQGSTSLTDKTYSLIYENFYPYSYGQNNWTYIFSKFPLFDTKISTSVSGRNYTEAKTRINGKIVQLVSMHPWAGQERDKRIADNTEIATRYSDIDYVLIGADTNAATSDELDPFRNNGYTLGNWGYWGGVSTVPDQEMPIDNIISKGFQINSFSVGTERATSDHLPVVSDITAIISEV